MYTLLFSNLWVSFLFFPLSPQTRENDEDDVGTLDSAVGSGSLAESTSLNIEVRSSDASNATVCTCVDCFPKICHFQPLSVVYAALHVAIIISIS